MFELIVSRWSVSFSEIVDLFDFSVDSNRFGAIMESNVIKIPIVFLLTSHNAR